MKRKQADDHVQVLKVIILCVSSTLYLEVRLRERLRPSCPREQFGTFQMLTALDLAQALGDGRN